MAIYNVSVKATYYDDLEIEADDMDEAYKLAIKTFVPTGDNCMAIDVYGLSPWGYGDDGDPNAVDKYRDEQRGI